MGEDLFDHALYCKSLRHPDLKEQIEIAEDYMGKELTVRRDLEEYARKELGNLYVNTAMTIYAGTKQAVCDIQCRVDKTILKLDGIQDWEWTLEMFEETSIEFKKKIADGYIEKIKNKKEKGDNKMEEILKVYERETRADIYNKNEEEKNKILQSSKLTKISNKAKETMEKELEKAGYLKDGKKAENYMTICVFHDNDKEVYKKILEIEEKKRVELEILNDKMEQVKACLKPCETYEQKMDVLKSYEIVDTIGKINI